MAPSASKPRSYAAAASHTSSTSSASSSQKKAAAKKAKSAPAKATVVNQDKEEEGSVATRAKRAKNVEFPTLHTQNAAILAFAEHVRTVPEERFRPFASCHVGSEWASRDLEDYRKGYPGQKINSPRLQDNFLFYSNELASTPNGDLIDNIHALVLPYTCRFLSLN